ILVLATVFLVSSLAIDLITPIWPIYIKSSLSASMIELGLLFSASNAVAAVMQIFSGFLSDKYGRKRIHVLGTLLAVLPPIMYAFASDWMDLIPWILLSGFATGLYLPIRWTIVADVSSTKTMASAYGWTNISWLVGSTIAPFAGGILADYFGIRFPFFISFIFLLAIFPATLLIQETRRELEEQDASHKNERTNRRGEYLPTIISFSMINIIQGVALGVTNPVIPIFVVANFQVDFTFIGTLYAIGFGVASIIVQIPGAKLSDRFDRRKVMFVTFVASTPFFFLFAHSRNTLELIAFMFLSRVVLNLHWSSFQTLMMDSTPSSKWGLMNGISAATFWIGLLTGNALSGILWDTWVMAPFYTSTFAMALSALPLLLLKETKGN
ncbi:MAG: MFS transporter, partial [Candidatus Bathyarchaeota archaeon]